MSVIVTTPELIRQVEEWAGALGQSAQDVVEDALHSYLDRLETDAIHAETIAFWEMYDDLRANYLGLHVAILHKRVVDSDADASALAQRIAERYGRLPVLIAPVTEQPQREIHWRGGRLERSPIDESVPL